MNQALATRPGSAPPSAAAEPTQYLTFNLGGEVYAIGILAIKEIIEYGGITTVPMMPPTISGVINLRGAVVPVMDLAVRLGKASSPIGRRSCIVVVELAGEEETQVTGVIVDAVDAVQEIAEADIEPPPSFGLKIASQFVAGIGKVGGRFVILLDIKQVLESVEMGSLVGDAPRLPMS